MKFKYDNARQMVAGIIRRMRVQIRFNRAMISRLESDIRNRNYEISQLQGRLDQYRKGSVYHDRINDRIEIAIKVDRDTARRHPEIINDAIGQIHRKVREALG